MFTFAALRAPRGAINIRWCFFWWGLSSQSISLGLYFQCLQGHRDSLPGECCCLDHDAYVMAHMVHLPARRVAGGGPAGAAASSNHMKAAPPKVASSLLLTGHGSKLQLVAFSTKNPKTSRTKWSVRELFTLLGLGVDFFSNKSSKIHLTYVPI